jgi:hypothetical protein
LRSLSFPQARWHPVFLDALKESVKKQTAEHCETDSKSAQCSRATTRSTSRRRLIGHNGQWTQHPCDFPLLTGWFAGPKADTVARLTIAELVTMGVESLAEIFNLPPDRITRNLVTSRAINWSSDPFARGACS